MKEPVEIPAELEGIDFTINKRSGRWTIWVLSPRAVGYGATLREAALEALFRQDELLQKEQVPLAMLAGMTAATV